MARRRSARPNPPAPPAWLLPAVGLGVVATVVYMATRPSASLPAPLPGPLPNEPIRTPGELPFDPGSVSLLDRLARSRAARRVFALQAMLYSYNFTGHSPDGIEDQATRADLARVNRLGGVPNEPNIVEAQSLVTAERVFRERASGAVRLLPFALPRTIVDRVNADARTDAPGFPLLQVVVAS